MDKPLVIRKMSDNSLLPECLTERIIFKLYVNRPNRIIYDSNCDFPLYYVHQCHIGIIIITRNPKVIWEEPRRHRSRHRIDSPAACASCALPTADEFNPSFAGTLYPRHTDGHTTTAYTALA